MGKDRSGNFHPGKGKPSGANKEEGLGLHPTDPDHLEEYLELTDKYTTGSDELDPSIPLRHPNRNTSKGEDQFKGKENTAQSNKSKDETFTEERATVAAEELPGVLSKDLFIELANYKAEPCISVYISTHRAGVEINEHFDPIAFKNVLQSLTQMLKEKGMEQGTIESLLEPGYELIRNDAFWNNLSNGLAVFISHGYFKYIKMSIVPVQETIVNTSFYLAPLLPLMTSKEYFYLLVISKKQAKLFRADAFGMEYIPVEALPEGIDDVKRLSEKDASTWRTGGRGGTGGANFHGIGGGNPDEKQNIATYLEAVDDILYKEIFNKENAPLLLAGVEYLIPIYRSVCDYHNLYEDALTGSHEHENTTTLFQQAREKMEPYFQQRVTKALETYLNSIATALTASLPEQVIPASYYARVSQLFVQKGAHIWGTFDENTSELQIHETQQEGDEDLLDSTIVKTLVNGGEVFLLDPEKMPKQSQIAALLRY